jgi:hypothetical protein
MPEKRAGESGFSRPSRKEMGFFGKMQKEYFQSIIKL